MNDISRMLTTIENYGFACEAGPLTNCGEWRELKRLCAGGEPRTAIDISAFQNTDDAPATAVLAAVRHCANSWEGSARLLGNVRASDISHACTIAIKAIGQIDAEIVAETDRAAVIEECAKIADRFAAADMALEERDPELSVLAVRDSIVTATQIAHDIRFMARQSAPLTAQPAVSCPKHGDALSHEGK